MAAVAVSDLVKSYDGVRAVDGVSFEVDKGEVFAFLGPNGAGKTTTVEILEGFPNRDQGRMDVLGLDPAERSASRQLRARMGVVLQELAVEPFLSVRQALTRNAGYYPNPRPVDEVVHLVGLEGKADSRIKNLSGGQRGASIWASGSWGTRSSCSSTNPPRSSTRPRGGARGS